MTIGTLRKTSLVDYPGLVASVIFLRGCNLRCPYCYNGALVNGDGAGEDFVTIQTLFEHLKKRAKIEKGLVVSGGEALLHPNLSQIIKYAHSLDLSVKLDTNGTLPQKLATLIKDKSTRPDFIALDFKTSPSRYWELGGKAGRKKVSVSDDELNKSDSCAGNASGEVVDKTDKATDKVINKSIDITTDITTDETVGKSIDTTSDITIDKAVGKSINRNTGKGIDRSIDGNSDKSTDKSIDEAVYKTTDKVIDKVGDKTSDKVGDDLPIIQSLKIISDNYSQDSYEVRSVLVPRLMTLSDIAQIDAVIPADCLWALSRFIPGSCLSKEYNELEPYTHAQIDELVSAAKALHERVVLR